MRTLEKSHTFEEGGAHLRLSVWDLLINLKNNYLLKKLLKWANRKCKDFSIYNVAFIKKQQKKTIGDIMILHLCTKHLDDMIYTVLLKLVIMGRFLPFYSPPKTLKYQNFEKMKRTAGDIIILHTCTKNHNHIR